MSRWTVSFFASAAVVIAIACSSNDDGSLADDEGNEDGGALAETGGPDATDPLPTDSGNGDADNVPEWVGPDGGIASKMNFFVTSKGGGKGGDLRANPDDADGLAGADALCKELANAVSPILGAKAWKAYLSTDAVDARSRIGEGPWYNAKGVLIANTKAHLHDEGEMNLLTLETNLDETGAQVPISGPNQHDILTGTNSDGTKSDDNCSNWTSSATGQQGTVGHSNRNGGGADRTSWTAAHPSSGCAEMGANSVRSGGGRGSFYCFAN